MSCLTSLIKCKRSQNKILLLQIKVRSTKKVIIKNTKTVTMKNQIILECQNMMRFQASYSADAFRFKSEMNKEIRGAVN
jgi:ABC-type uncharacterized transport system permease subunit